MEDEVDGQDEQDGEDEGEEEEAEEAHGFVALVVGGGVRDAGCVWCGSVDVVKGSGWGLWHEDEGFGFVRWVGAAEGDIFGSLRCGTEVVSHRWIERIWNWALLRGVKSHREFSWKGTFSAVVVALSGVVARC